MNKQKLLLIDDDKGFLAINKKIFTYAGYEIDVSDDPSIVRKQDLSGYDIIITDMVMPQMDGIRVIREILERYPKKRIIVLTGNPTIETAVEAIKTGAYTYLEKPISPDTFVKRIKDVFRVDKEAEDADVLIGEQEIYMGASDRIERIKNTVKRIASVDSSVLLLGESGTGKEVIANMIHRNSARRDNPFVKINCAAVPEQLFESELFGFERGSFTGALKTTKGKMEVANGGTLFLDEIGELSRTAQSKLLRAIQEKEIYRVGGETPIRVDFRLICATNSNLRQIMNKGDFREDLYYRINVASIELPPLRERQEDIDGFIDYYCDYFQAKFGKSPPLFSESIRNRFRQYKWPGNIREIRNVMERIFVFTDEGKPVKEADLPTELLNGDENGGSKGIIEAKHEFEKRYLIDALEKNDWNISKTALMIGLSRRNLHEKINQYHLRERDGEDDDR